MTEQTDDKLKALDEVAKAAMTLLKPPYRRGNSILPCANRERNDWDNLRQTLIKAGYNWEEYT